ncbi:hypothetical protein PM116P6_00034 [Parabacteroides phage PM116P6]|nr:hypothetical protein PM116P6_00034 [Parabacteroides phage PM116P6]WAX17631.1 hypothetical protein PM116P7_00016 [Parabacteroides phage PM116P7]
MDLVRVEFIVKGSVVVEQVNLNAVSRLFCNERGCFVGLIGESFTKQISFESYQDLVGYED